MMLCIFIGIVIPDHNPIGAVNELGTGEMCNLSVREYIDADEPVAVVSAREFMRLLGARLWMLSHYPNYIGRLGCGIPTT